ncbi:MAG TPA: hypothetical protein PKV93_06930 [Fervidobacterium sp.]|nr:hypothetical protein [Fervidobacterium sp.]
MSGTENKGHRQRLRERFINGEAGSRSDEALLELLLTYAIPQKDVQPLAKHLISEYGSLSSLLEAPMETLCQSKGIKENSAVLLKLVDWIRKYHSKQPESDTLKPPIQTTLDEIIFLKEGQTSSPVVKPRHNMVAQRYGTGLFSKAMLKEAIEILPRLPESESLDEIRSFLRAELHFSAEQTRQRYSNYITQRMFPAGYADTSLRMFAKAFAGTKELREVCFYRFLFTEPLIVEMIEELIIPNLGTGQLPREHIRKRLSEKFPDKSIKECSIAIVDALTAGGIVKADRTKLSFAYREIPVASFAFVLHSEFPEPGMYDIKELEENRLIQAMLWNPERLLNALYELRNRGLISKVSEIDNIRQFTTKYKLAEVVERIISGVKNHEINRDH